MSVESGFSEEVQTIQIISTDYLHVEKEVGKKLFLGNKSRRGKIEHSQCWWPCRMP